MSDTHTTPPAARQDAGLADRHPVVLSQVVCPDGTTYTVYADGSWDQHTWDGFFVRDSGSLYTPEATEADRAAEGAHVLVRLGLA